MSRRGWSAGAEVHVVWIWSFSLRFSPSLFEHAVEGLAWESVALRCLAFSSLVGDMLFGVSGTFIIIITALVGRQWHAY